MKSARTKYAYAHNINNTGDGGIINLFDQTILCWSSREKSDKIIKAFEALESLIDPLTGLVLDSVAHYIGSDKAYAIEQALQTK
jgi:hypothetical protein